MATDRGPLTRSRGLGSGVARITGNSGRRFHPFRGIEQGSTESRPTGFGYAAAIFHGASKDRTVCQFPVGRDSVEPTSSEGRMKSERGMRN